MSLKTALLAVSLAIFAAPQASPLQNGFWDYFSQLTSNKDSMDPAQQLKWRGQEMKNLKDSHQDGANYMGNVLEKLAPLNSGLQPQFYRDANSLRQLIQGEMESLRMKLSPYSDEAHQQMSESLKKLHLRLMPLAENLMDLVLLGAKELQQHFKPNLSMKAPLLENADKIQKFGDYFAAKIAFHTDRVKEMFHPFADRLVAEIHRSMEELRKNMDPHATATPAQVSQYIQEFSDKLTQSARDLHLEIQRNLEHLKGQLSLHSSTLTEQYTLNSPGDPQRIVGPSMEVLAQEVQERIEEFRRDTFLQIDNFTRTVDGEMEDMKLRLSPPPSYLEEFQENTTPLVDLHVRLDSLWKAISQSLSEPSGSSY